MTYLVSIGLFLQPIRRLTAFTQQYQSGMSGFDRFVELMAARPSIVDRPDAKPLTHVKGHIEIREVSFEYEESEAVLHGVSLEIRPGQTVALVGSSGGGKTTLCRLIPRFYDVTSGQILIDGTSVRDIKLEDLRKAIGLVQQDVFLFTGTIKENILYGKPTATDEEVVEAAKNANIHDFIDSLPNKYDTYVGERGVKLSGGQKQRVSIARVFLKNPPILILDEATSSLDTVTERQIQASLARLSEGRTTLVIAHRLSTVQNADLIVVLEEGRIQEMGSHRELLAREGIYAKLYHSQFQQLSEVG
jgi:ATP-binding cassette subfamily B protein